VADLDPVCEQAHSYLDIVPIRGTLVNTRSLLIVNADDWGGFREGTDAIDECFKIGAISSTTAMVHMSDSRRAAELALESGWPVGLHLNLTQPFDALDVQPSVRQRQRWLCAYFANLRYRRWIPSADPRIHTLIASAVHDQLEQFAALYGREPTHIDSHQHVHVCPDVFLSSALPRGARVRQTISPPPSALSGPRVLARRAKHRLLARRFVTASCFWAARELSPTDDAIPIATAAALSRERSVEIMVHPSFERELRVLRSHAWTEAVANAPLGSYSMLG
jgi:chitin disaccharide deacetylase